MRSRDFTLQSYDHLLAALRVAAYEVVPYEQFITDEPERAVILRHDVDRRPERALHMAELEHERGSRATYYFRAVPESWSPSIVQRIVELGHEIGYHYEDLTLARGDTTRALQGFKANLAMMRAEYPVTTICMHGSPLSRWDNRAIWDTCDYKQFGLLGEPYLDLDFSRILYITDTGRGWNQKRYSRRDFVESAWDVEFSSTFELAAWIAAGNGPDHIMINTHPERWTDSLLGWSGEVIRQAVKRPLKMAYLAMARATKRRIEA